MAYVNSSRSVGFDFSGITAPLKALSERYARYTVYRETLNELNGLTTRELSDLGLSRSCTRRIAIEAAYGT